MPRRRQKNCYVVLEAKHLTTPTIFLDWYSNYARTDSQVDLFQGENSSHCEQLQGCLQRLLQLSGRQTVSRSEWHSRLWRRSSTLWRRIKQSECRLAIVCCLSRSISWYILLLFVRSEHQFQLLLLTWDSDGARAQVDGFSGACHKSYATFKQCQRAIETSREARTHREHLDEVSNLMNVMHHWWDLSRGHVCFVEYEWAECLTVQRPLKLLVIRRGNLYKYLQVVPPYCR